MKINIFFFISKFIYGGAGNAIFNFLKNLDLKKFKLHLIFLDGSDYQSSLPTHVKSIRLRGKIKFSRTFFSFFKIKKILQNSKIAKEKNIFISNIHYSNVLSILFLRKIKGLKIILFERTSLKELDLFKDVLSFLKNKVVKFLIKITYSKADKILANSKVLSLELKQFNLKSDVVYSGSINKLIKQRKYKKKSFFNIIAVGRLSLQKDYLTLLKSISYIKNKNFIIKIFGEGELKKDLTQFTKNNNLQKYVRFVGHEKNRDKIYKNANLLIHTAVFEGLPNSIVEALNYGVPVIAANSHGGTSEVLGNGKFGQLFQTQNSRDLAKKINYFMLKPVNLEKRVKKSKFFIKRFTHHRTCKSLEKILMSISN
jgi:glycosyltransferase involved in cell wall biosynthesis